MLSISVDQNEQRIIPLLWTGKENEISYEINLNGKGASVVFLALLLGKKAQTLNLKTNVYHNHPETKSEVIVKGALTDLAQVNFEGLVKINKGAKGTNAWLAAHILLLSEKAKGQAIPSLEILENDIKAGHATTVGRVNDLEVFYLMSRGISKEIAKKLIIEGFLSSMLGSFPEDISKKARKELVSYAKG